MTRLEEGDGVANGGTITPTVIGIFQFVYMN